MVGVAGSALTVTVVELDGTLRHPLALVTRTVYVPVVVTVILDVTAPVDHR